MTLHALTCLLLVISVIACSPEDNTPIDSSKKIEYKMMRASFNSLEGEWELTDFKKASLTPDLKNKATLTLTKRSEDLLQMSGRSFVNWYGGSFRLDETKGLIVSTGPMVSTEIGAAPELMEAETRHLYGLEKAIAFELTTSSQLKLYLGEKTSESTEVMIFNRKN